MKTNWKTNSMMLALMSGAMLMTRLSLADSSPSWSCEGEKIQLSSKTTYLGENRKFSQTLYILHLKGTSLEGTNSTAYFLNSDEDIGKFGVHYISAKNEVGGRFDLVMSAPENLSDDNLTRMRAKGTLSYSHGPLKGNKEPVTCTFE